jgi:hypothetical protein
MGTSQAGFSSVLTACVRACGGPDLEYRLLWLAVDTSDVLFHAAEPITEQKCRSSGTGARHTWGERDEGPPWHMRPPKPFKTAPAFCANHSLA